jgi:hypothetical protein
MKKSLTFITLAVLAAMLVTPVFAGPKFTKITAPLDECGKVIYNTNPEDHELEVEVEECLELGALVPELEEYITAEVYVNDVLVGEVMVDAEGNGKVTIMLDEPGLGVSDVVKVVYGDVTLESGVWE